MAIPPTIRRIITIQPIGLQVFHPIAVKLIYLLSNNDYTVEEVVDTASEDQVLAGQLLKMANSTNYIGRVRIETIKDALIRLGAHRNRTWQWPRLRQRCTCRATALSMR